MAPPPLVEPVTGRSLVEPDDPLRPVLGSGVRVSAPVDGEVVLLPTVPLEEEEPLLPPEDDCATASAAAPARATAAAAMPKIFESRVTECS